MNQPFPITRVAVMALFQVLRLYFALPWWVMGIVGVFAFVLIAKR